MRVPVQNHVLGNSEAGAPGVQVRSGHYEVHLNRRRMQPCYWPDSRHRVQRGSWFLLKGSDWVPLKVQFLLPPNPCTSS